MNPTVTPIAPSDKRSARPAFDLSRVQSGGTNTIKRRPESVPASSPVLGLNADGSPKSRKAGSLGEMNAEQYTISVSQKHQHQRGKTRKSNV